MLTPDLDTVTARCAVTELARHPRAWTYHHNITDPAHGTTVARLRAALRTPPCSSCRLTANPPA